jgi:hypothetical protein
LLLQSLIKILLTPTELDLCRIIGRTLEQMYRLQKFSGSTSDWAMFYVPRRARDLDLAICEDLQRNFDEWAERLNNYCKLGYGEGDMFHAAVLPLTASRASLNLFHLLTLELLQRPFIVAGLRGSATPPNLNEQVTIAAERAKAAVQEMSEILRLFRQKRALHSLLSITVTCILNIAASCAVGSKNAFGPECNHRTTTSHQKQYEECIACLEALDDVWPIAKAATAMVRRMISSDQASFARNLRMLSKPEGEPGPLKDVHNRAVDADTPLTYGGSSSMQDTLPPIQQWAPLSPLNRDLDYISSELTGTFTPAMYPYYWMGGETAMNEGYAFYEPDMPDMSVTEAGNLGQ